MSLEDHLPISRVDHFREGDTRQFIRRTTSHLTGFWICELDETVLSDENGIICGLEKLPILFFRLLQGAGAFLDQAFQVCRVFMKPFLQDLFLVDVSCNAVDLDQTILCIIDRSCANLEPPPVSVLVQQLKVPGLLHRLASHLSLGARHDVLKKLGCNDSLEIEGPDLLQGVAQDFFTRGAEVDHVPLCIMTKGHILEVFPHLLKNAQILFVRRAGCVHKRFGLPDYWLRQSNPPAGKKQ